MLYLLFFIIHLQSHFPGNSIIPRAATQLGQNNRRMLRLFRERMQNSLARQGKRQQRLRPERILPKSAFSLGGVGEISQAIGRRGCKQERVWRQEGQSVQGHWHSGSHGRISDAQKKRAGNSMGVTSNEPLGMYTSDDSRKSAEQKNCPTPAGAGIGHIVLSRSWPKPLTPLHRLQGCSRILRRQYPHALQSGRSERPG